MRYAGEHQPTPSRFRHSPARPGRDTGLRNRLIPRRKPHRKPTPPTRIRHREGWRPGGLAPCSSAQISIGLDEISYLIRPKCFYSLSPVRRLRAGESRLKVEVILVITMIEVLPPTFAAVSCNSRPHQAICGVFRNKGLQWKEVHFQRIAYPQHRRTPILPSSVPVRFQIVHKLIKTFHPTG